MPAPVPATRRRATEQPLGSPTAHPPAQPEPEVSAQRARWEPAKPSLEEEAEREGPCLLGEEEEKEEELRGGSCLLVKEMREDPHLPVVREAREGPRLTGWRSCSSREWQQRRYRVRGYSNQEQ